MEFRRVIFVFQFLTALSPALFGQTGTIRGTIVDDKSNDPVIAANVIVVNQSLGAGTDVDGKFSIVAPVGVYNLEISYMGFQTLVVEKVVVIAGEVALLNNLRLFEETFGTDLGAAVIKVKAQKSSETDLIKTKMRSVVIMDGISASKMELVGDATAAEAAKRVTGVSIEDGKYIYVRGLGDRYTKTTLNGVEIPGLDPDKNTLQMDLFPTSLIDKITVSKNFSADLPADFTGGLVNVETKDFPDERIFKVTVGTSFNPAMHLNGNYLSYQGGKTDFLGFDDGTRALPQGADASAIPTPVSGASSSEVNQFVQQFNPQLAAQRKMSLLDFSAGISMGNQFRLHGKDSSSDAPTLGYVFSMSYKTDYKYYDDVVFGEFQKSIKPGHDDLVEATTQTGEMGERNALIGILGGLAYKSQYNKIRFTAMRLQSGESRAGIFDVYNNGAAVGQSGFISRSHNLEYNERSLTNILFQGNHTSVKPGWETIWRLSPTFSVSNDPDIRKTAFTYTPVDTSFIAGAGGNPSRTWRSLNEFSNTSRIDFTRKFSFRNQDHKLKFGFSHVYKQRQYEILFYDIQFFGSQNWNSDDPNDILKGDNIYPTKQNNIYYQSGNNNPNPNQYNSTVNNLAAYASGEFALSSKLKSIVGLRTEKFVQRHTGRDQAYASGDHINGNNLDRDKVLESFDLFPSFNLIYSYQEKANLRLTYGKTIARPSFKELSYAQIIDPLTNRIFNGSLFQYSNWNGELEATRIQNFDLRWELFLNRNQLFSVSAFAKAFNQPIELVRIPEQQTSTEYQPRNVGNGSLYGVEVEIQKNFDFIHVLLSKFSFSGNLTMVESRIDMTETEFQSRMNFIQEGETILSHRQMAGQSPWVINGGISYNDFNGGTNVGLFYNVKGPTLYIVGGGLFPDIYNEPFHSLNFSFNKKFGADQRTQLEFNIANLLNDRLESYYQSGSSAKEPFAGLNPGRSFSFGLKHAF